MLRAIGKGSLGLVCIVTWMLVACAASEPLMIGTVPRADESLSVFYGGSRPPNVVIVHTVYLEIAVSDVAGAVEKAGVIATDFGGYVMSSQSWYQNGKMYGTVAVAVPMDDAESTRQTLLRLGSLVRDRVSETVLSTGQGVPFAQITVQFEPGKPVIVSRPPTPTKQLMLADTFRWMVALVVSLFQSLAHIIMFLAVLVIPFALIFFGIVDLLRRSRKG